MMTHQTHQILFLILLFVLTPLSMAATFVAYNNWRYPK